MVSKEKETLLQGKAINRRDASSRLTRARAGHGNDVVVANEISTSIILTEM